MARPVGRVELGREILNDVTLHHHFLTRLTRLNRPPWCKNVSRSVIRGVSPSPLPSLPWCYTQRRTCCGFAHPSFRENSRARGSPRARVPPHPRGSPSAKAPLWSTLARRHLQRGAPVVGSRRSVRRSDGCQHVFVVVQHAPLQGAVWVDSRLELLAGEWAQAVAVVEHREDGGALVRVPVGRHHRVCGTKEQGTVWDALE